MANKRNVIITFANQKGGTGKTTMCAMFAHYLSLLGEKVTVIDADRQQTLTQLRRLDLMNQDEKPRPNHDKRYKDISGGDTWEVHTHIINNAEDTGKYMARLKEIEGVVLIDSPGSLTQDGLVPLLVMSDFIFCPFIYEMGTILSTAQFLVFLGKLHNRFGAEMKAQLSLIPNRHKPMVGTSAERSRIEQTILTLSRYGKVSPEIKDVGRIQQYSTTTFNAMQKNACEPAFQFLLKENGLAALFGIWADEREKEAAVSSGESDETEKKQ